MSRRNSPAGNDKRVKKTGGTGIPCFDIQALEKRIYLSSSPSNRGELLSAVPVPESAVAAAANRAASSLLAGQRADVGAWTVRSVPRPAPRAQVRAHKPSAKPVVASNPAHHPPKPHAHAPAHQHKPVQKPKPIHKPSPVHNPTPHHAAGSSNTAALAVASLTPTPADSPPTGQWSSVVQKDGKLVALSSQNGSFRVARYKIDGSLDQTFGTGGTTVVTFDPGHDQAYSLAVNYAGGSQVLNPNWGKIVIAGRSTGGFVVARLFPNGTLDGSFGVGGKVIQTLSSGLADELVLRPDGTTLVGGTDGSGSPTVIRLTPNGTKDLTLGTDGVFHGPIDALVGGTHPIAAADTIVLSSNIRRPGQIIFEPQDCCGGGGGCDSYGAPVVTLSASTNSALEGSTVTFHVHIEDPNPFPTWVGSVTYAPGVSEPLTVTGADFDFPHTFSEDESYDVVASITDTADTTPETGYDHELVNISEPTPTVSLSTSGLREGRTSTLVVAFSHWDSDDTNTVGINFGDGTGGTYSASASQITLYHQYHEDGNFVVTMVPTLTETGGTITGATTTATINVAEADPLLKISGPYHTAVGATYTLGLSELDPADPLGNWSVNWGDGTPIQSVGSTLTSAYHVFQDMAATDLITVAATDDGTLYTSNTLPIAVQQTTSDPPATNLNVLFQPWDHFTDGFNEDFGLVFGDHGNIYQSPTRYVYGWVTDARSTAVRRSGSDGPGYDTFIPLPTPDIDGRTSNSWAIGLANGTYQVSILSGDPTRTSGATYTTVANGTQIIPPTNAGPLAARWVTGTATVTVSDGWLKVYSGTGANNNVINTISITPTAHIGSAPSTAPAGVSAYTESSHAVNLNWADASDNESGFRIERAIDGATSYSVVTTTVSNADQFTDTTVSPAHTYAYRVRPVNVVGASTTYGSATTTTPSSDAEAPYKGTAWTIASSGASTIQAEDFDTGGPGIAYDTARSYNSGGRYRDTGVGIATGGPVEGGYYVGWNFGGNDYNYTVNVAAAGNYRADFRVASSGKGGTFDLKVDGILATAKLSIPDTGGWNVFQTVSVDSIHLPAGRHKLTLEATEIGNVAEGNFNWMAFTPLPAAPSAPVNLYVSALTDGSVKLQWTDQTSTATAYKVLRATLGGSFSAITTTLPATAVSYTDTSAGAGTTYLYQVVATNSQGDSAPSNTASVRTPQAVAASLAPLADAQVVSSDASGNYGGEKTLQTRHTTQRIYLAFGTSQLSSSVGKAMLRLFGSVASDQTGVAVNAYGLPSAPPTWSENTINWSNQPSYSPSYTLSPLSTQTVNSSSGHWYEWDVTAYVNAHRTDGTVGFMVEALSDTLTPVSFNSRTGDENAPQLLVTTSSAIIPTAPIGLTATAVSSSEIDLAWTLNSTVNGGITIKKSTDGTTWTTVTTASGTATSAPITGLSPDQFYYFQIFGTIGSNTASSNIASARTWPVTTLHTISGRVYDSHLKPLEPTSDGKVHLTNVLRSDSSQFARIQFAGAVGYLAADNAIIVTNTSEGTSGMELDEVLRDGKIQTYAVVAGVSSGDENTMEIAQPGNIGLFEPGDIFYAVAGSNQLLRVPAANPATVDKQWAVLYGDTGGIVGMTFDTAGLFGGNLICITASGGVWSVDRFGNPARLAQLPPSAYEAAVVLPKDSRFGPMAGQILISSDDDEGNLFAVDETGAVQHYTAPPFIEQMKVIPPDENFFASATDFQVVAAPASDFSSYVGDLLAIQEHGGEPIFLTWNGGNWLSTTLTTVPGYERMGFAPAGINDGVDTLEQTQDPIGGLSVILTDAAGATLATTTSCTLSGQVGNYSFTGLTAGTTYHVSLSVPSGYHQIRPSTVSPSYTFVMPANENETDTDFGIELNIPAGSTDQAPSFQSTPSPAFTGITLPASLSAIAPGYTYSYTFTATDADGDNDYLTAELTLGEPPMPDWVTLSGVTQSVTSGVRTLTGTITLTPPFSAAGTDNPFLIKVTDSRKAVAMQPFTVHINQPQPPDAPTGLSAVPGASGVTVSWTDPAGTIDGYVVFWGLTQDAAQPNQDDFPGGSYQQVTPGTATSTTISNSLLLPGRTYTFTVIAYANGAQSRPREYAVVTTYKTLNGLEIGPEPDIPPKGQPVEVREGTTFSTTLAIFSDSAPGRSASDYTARIDWGDGSSSTAATLTPQGTPGWYWVQPTLGHVYVENGGYSLNVSVTYTGSPSASISTTDYVHVHDDSLTLTPAVVSDGAFTQFSLSGYVTLATFTDSDDPSPIFSHYEARINWGEEPETGATIAQISSGTLGPVFAVVEHHRYGTDAPSPGVMVEVWHNFESPAELADAINVKVATAPAVPVPTGLVDYPISNNQLQIEWKQDPALAGYILWRKSSVNSTPVELPPKTGKADDIEFYTVPPVHDGGLSNTITYQYGIQGVGLDGRKSPGPGDSSFSYTPSLSPWGAPVAPSSLSIEALSGQTVHLTWAQSITGAGVQRWDVLRKIAGSGDPFVSLMIAGNGASTPEFWDLNASRNTSYTYAVVAIDDFLQHSTQATIGVSTGNSSIAGLPPAPTSLSVQTVGAYPTGTGQYDYRLNLSWHEGSTQYPLLGYDIYRATQPDFGDAKLIGKPFNPYYFDDILDSSSSSTATYYYRVEAVVANELNEEIASDPATVSLGLQQTVVAPLATGKPKVELEHNSANSGNVNGVTGAYTGAVVVIWSEPRPDNEAEFDVYRSDNGTTYGLVGRVPAGGEQYVDGTALPGTTYHYKVASVNQSTLSPVYSAVSDAIVTPQSTVPAPIELHYQPVWDKIHNIWQVKLDWAPGQEVVPDPTPTIYHVYRRTDTTGYQRVDGTTSATNVLDTNGGRGLDPSSTYYYVVRAERIGEGLSAASTEVKVPLPDLIVPQPAILAIDNPAVSTDAAKITINTPIRGIVESAAPGWTLSWSLSLHPTNTTDSTQNIVLATGTSSAGAIEGGDALLADLDPTQFPSGSYQIILQATETNGGSSLVSRQVVVPISLESYFKLGNLTLPISDASFTVLGGTPITIGRDYDSQRVNTASRDFGYGWRMDLWDTDLHTTADPGKSTYVPTPPGLKFGDLVYITLPGGEQHVFAFEPKSINPPSSVSGYLGAVDTYTPQFIAIDGSGARLDAPLDPSIPSPPTPFYLSIDPYTNQYWDQFHDPYNPARSAFDGNYTLTTNDGRKYAINSASGLISTFTDAQNNVTSYPITGGANSTTSISFTPAGGSSTPIVQIIRDGSSRVVSVSDVRIGGTQIKYLYDTDGNLQFVTDRSGKTTTYAPYGELGLMGPYEDRQAYVLIKRNSDGEYWNNAFGGDFRTLDTSTSNFQQYAYPLIARTSGTTYLSYSADLPTGIPVDTTLTITYYLKDAHDNLAHSTDQSLFSQTTHPPVAPPPVTGGRDSYLTGVTNAQGVAVLTASYDASGKLTSLADSYSNKSTVSTGNFNGSAAGQTTTDLTPPSGAGPSTGTTENLYDRHGSVTREIQTLRSPDGSSIVGYQVTVHDYVYAVGDVLGDVTRDSTGVSNANALGSQTDWQPFFVPFASAGIRYTAAPTTVRQVTTYGVINDPLHPEDSPGAFRPSSVTVYGPDGLPLTTTYLYNRTTSPAGVLETVVDPYGNTTVQQYSPHFAQLLSTVNPAGETAGTHYTTDGQVQDTFAIHGTTTLTLSQNTYFTSGANAGLLQYGIDDTTGMTTTYAYTADGLVNTLTHTWTDTTTHTQVVSETVYDAEGRTFQQVDENGNSTYTYYDSAGRVWFTIDQYGNATVNTYDAKGNLVRTLYPDGTEVRTAYDAMNRPVWQTDRFMTGETAIANTLTPSVTFSYSSTTTTDNNSTANLTQTVYDAMGRTVQTNRYSGAKIPLSGDLTANGYLTPTSPTYTTSSSNFLSQTSTHYNALGQADNTIGPDGQATVTTFNPDGSQNSIINSPYASAVLRDKPAGYWRLGDASGAAAADSTGNGSTGTYNGSYTLGSASALPHDTNTSTLLFPGYVSVNSGSLSRNVGDVSAEAWIKTGAQGYIIGNDATVGFLFGVGTGVSTGTLGYYNGSWVQGGSTRVDDGNWHHVAVVATASSVKFYVDGQADGTVGVDGRSAITSSLWIGRDGAWYLYGDFQDVAVYDHALSATQIAQHYAAAPMQATKTTSGYDHVDLVPSNPSNGQVLKVTVADAASGQLSTLAFTLGASDTTVSQTAIDLAATINAAYTTLPQFAGVSASVAPSADLPSSAGVRLIANRPINVTTTNGSSATLSIKAIHVSGSTDGLNHTSTTYYDNMGRGTTTMPDGSFGTTLYSAGGTAVSGQSTGLQSITGYQKTEIDAIGNATGTQSSHATDSFYDLAGRLTDVYQPAVADPYKAAVLGDAPMAYWRLGESGGSVAHDSSGHGSDGTYTSTTLGQGGALANDADTSANFFFGYATVNSSTLIRSSGDVTVEAWIKTNSGGFIASSGAGGFAFTVSSGGPSGALGYWNGSSWVYGSTSLIDNNWHQVAVVATAGSVTFYVDGQVDATVSGSGQTPITSSFGIAVDGNDLYLGRIDELSLYDHALSSAQIANHYSTGAGTVAAPYKTAVLGDAPVGYWRLGETSGTTAYDATGHGNNGGYSGTYTLGQGSALTNDSDFATQFSGGFVSVANGAMARSSGDVSVEAWVKTTANGYIFADWVSGFSFGIGTGVTSGTLGYFNGSSWVQGGSAVVNDGSWHQVAVVATSSSVAFYVDGVADGSVSGSGQAPITSQISIGSNGGGYGYFDEVSVYDHALTAAQVANHYSAGKGAIAAAAGIIRPHWSYTYDAMGNELTQTDPKGDVTTWGYTYTTTGSVTQLTDTSRTLPGGQQETFHYDSFGRLAHHYDFDGNSDWHTYNNSGIHAGLEDHVDYYYPPTSYPYDSVYYYYGSLNRLYEVQNYPAVGSQTYTYYNYDEAGGAVNIDPSTGAKTAVSGDTDGLLTSVSGPQGTIHYIYDAPTGRLVETWTGTTYSTAMTDTRYGYDAMGHLASTSIVKQNGSAPTLASSNPSYFDAKGDAITPATNWPTTINTYDAAGQLIKVAFPNGTETDYDYSSYWTTASGGVFGTEVITNKRGSTILSSFTYQFDADRRKISDTEVMTDPGEAATYSAKYTWSYDAVSRLTQEKYDYGNNDTLSGGAGLTADDYTSNFVYDLDGNRVMKTTDTSNDGTINTTVTDSYNANNELMAETDSASYNTVYTYDANGSPTRVVKTTGGTTSTTNYFYDPRNRMIDVDPGGNTTYGPGSSGGGTYSGTTTDDTVYTYDDAGNIVSQKTGTAAAKTYLLDTNNPTGYVQRIEAWSGGSTPDQSYVIANTIQGQMDGTTPSFFMADGEQSTRQLTAYTSSGSTNGHVTGIYDYTAFGEGITFTSTHAANSAASIMLFKGEPVDLITGNVIMGVREDVPAIGRFLTQDPSIFAPGDLDNANLYIFVGGNPINFHDPSGNLGAADVTVASREGNKLDTMNLPSTRVVQAAGVQIATTGINYYRLLTSLFAVGALGGGALMIQYQLAALSAFAQNSTGMLNAIHTAEQTALRTTTMTQQQVQQLPLFLVYQTGPLMTPDIWKNDDNALRRNAAWVTLNYLGPGKKSSSRAALRVLAARQLKFPTAAKNSLDEYPFASTAEGGGTGGIPPELMYVKGSENSRQGGLLSAFYQGQMNSKPGAFLVVLLP
jgi:RHS repeat-associated protein